MNAGKSTLLLQAAYNYKEMGMDTVLLTADFDNRAGQGKIASRIGISEKAELYNQKSNLYNFCLLYTSPSPRDRTRSRMPSSA